MFAAGATLNTELPPRWAVFGLVAAARGEFSVPSSVAAVRVVSIFDEFKKHFGFVFFCFEYG